MVTSKQATSASRSRPPRRFSAERSALAGPRARPGRGPPPAATSPASPGRPQTLASKGLHAVGHTLRVSLSRRSSLARRAAARGVGVARGPTGLPVIVVGYLRHPGRCAPRRLGVRGGLRGALGCVGAGADAAVAPVRSSRACRLPPSCQRKKEHTG